MNKKQFLIIVFLQLFVLDLANAQDFAKLRHNLDAPLLRMDFVQHPY